MKRFSLAIFAALVMFCAWLPFAVATSAAPETLAKLSMRAQQLIIGGLKLYNSSYNTGLVFRPVTTNATTLDTTITASTPAAARTYNLADFGANGSFLITATANTVTSAQIGTGSAKRVINTIPFRGLAVQALDDSTAFTTLITPGRAGILKQVSVAAITVPVGGTNTVAVLKNNATAMLAANFDPTTLTTVVASKPALHGTAGNLAFTATDTISIVWTAGAQSTDAVGATVSLEYEPTDF